MAIYGTLGDLEVNADYPSIQPTLDLNFAKTKSLDPRITFYRNSLATYTDDKGIIRTVPENVPRFDHNPTTGESLGLLIEESRTNLMPYSDNTVLSSSASVTTSRSTGLDGNPTSALNVTYNSNSGSFVLTTNATVSATNTYTFSVYIKKNVNSTSGNAGAVMYSYFNSGTAGQWSGTILNEDGQHLGQAPVGVWKRYSKTITVTSGTGVQITLPGYDTSGLNADYFGAQIELGAFATSYIPTSGSAETRSADVCYMDGTNFSNWYNSVEGSYFIDFNLKNTSTSDIVILSSPVTSGRYPWLLYRFTEDFWKYYNGVNGVANISTGTTFSSQNKFCISYSSSQGSVSKDGILTLSNNSEISVGSGINANSIKIFSGSTINEFPTSGTIKRFTYYPKRLTNTQLQNLTA